MGESWYYAQAGNQLGPVAIEGIFQLIRGGQIQPADLVWTEGLPQWQSAQSVPALASAFQVQPAPGPILYSPISPLNYESAVGQRLHYAGFWIRVLAAIIDALVTGFGGAIVGEIVGAIIGANGAAPQVTQAASLITWQFSGILLNWLYSAAMESSATQATLGKMAVGIKVIDVRGNRISFVQATGRHFAKFISTLILMVGYMMAGFTERKQGLHDIMAGTFVVWKGQ